jgi:hypothetical protein
MRKIEHAHHAENQRQARAEHEQQQSIAHPIEQGNEKKLHGCKKHPVRADTSDRVKGFSVRSGGCHGAVGGALSGA